jgi:DNA mismatch repair protein MutL
VLTLAPASRAGRIHDLLGADFAGASLAVSAEGAPEGGLTIWGLAGGPAFSRATAAEQHLVVNRRPVKDPLLRAALRVAYREVMAPGRHPAAAFFLELDPAEVDVNVHPMKDRSCASATRIRARRRDRRLRRHWAVGGRRGHGLCRPRHAALRPPPEAPRQAPARLREAAAAAGVGAAGQAPPRPAEPPRPITPGPRPGSGARHLHPSRGADGALSWGTSMAAHERLTH